MDEKKMLRALRRGNEKALEWFIERYTGYVNTIVYNIIGLYMTPSDIEEVSSDVFFILWENAKKVEPEKVKAYLSAVARNKAKERLRQVAKEIPLEEDLIIVAESNVESDMERKEEAHLLNAALEKMDECDQEIFLRHYYYYQTVAQISGELGMNLSTVKSRLRRGREQLKSILQKGGMGNGKKDI